jgi:hypothetical protein
LEVKDRLLPLQQTEVVVLSIVDIFFYFVKQPMSEPIQMTVLVG